MPRSRLAAASLYIDFEYRLDGAQLILCCVLVVLPDGRELRHTIDFRDFASGRSQLAALYHTYRDATWFAYAALAELKVFETAGFDVRGMNWVCLLAEATQIVGSHDRYYLHKKPGTTMEVG